MLHVIPVDHLDWVNTSDDISSQAASPESSQLPSAAPQENVTEPSLTEPSLTGPDTTCLSVKPRRWSKSSVSVAPPSDSATEPIELLIQPIAAPQALPSHAADRSHGRLLEGRTVLALPPAEGTTETAANSFCFHFNPEELIQGDPSRSADYNKPRVRSSGIPAGMIGAGVVTLGVVSSFIVAEATRQPIFKPAPNFLSEDGKSKDEQNRDRKAQPNQSSLTQKSVTRPEQRLIPLNPTSLVPPQMPPLPPPKFRPQVVVSASLPGLMQPGLSSPAPISPATRLEDSAIAQGSLSVSRSTRSTQRITPDVATAVNPPGASVAVDPQSLQATGLPTLAGTGAAQDGLQLIAVQPSDRPSTSLGAATVNSTVNPTDLPPAKGALSNRDLQNLSPIDRLNQQKRLRQSQQNATNLGSGSLATRNIGERQPTAPSTTVPNLPQPTHRQTTASQPIQWRPSPAPGISSADDRLVPLGEMVRPNGSSTLPQNLQEFIALPQRSPRALTSLPLTQQAALSAIRRQKVEAFSVVTLNDRDYLNRWKLTGQFADHETPIGLPAYGFIDYLQQLIVIPQAIAPMALGTGESN
ncbi:MAG: hypothetical protein VKJ24_09130 [Synechococcales bacterium]|nr:hypothetical protein [Synechococcales bacterium]